MEPNFLILNDCIFCKQIKLKKKNEIFYKSGTYGQLRLIRINQGPVWNLLG